MALPANLGAAMERARVVERSFQRINMGLPGTEQMEEAKKNTFGNTVKDNDDDPKRFRDPILVSTGDKGVDEITELLKGFKAEILQEVKRKEVIRGNYQRNNGPIGNVN